MEPSQKMKDMMSQKDLDMMGWKTTAQRWEWLKGRCEDEFLREVIKWLTAHGFESRNKKTFGAKTPKYGWFMHMNEAQKNPMILDVPVWTLDGHFTELELKIKDGVVSKNQKFILEISECAEVFYSMQDVVVHMEAFIKKYCVPKADAEPVGRGILENLMEYVMDGYQEEFATPGFKRAVEQAQMAMAYRAGQVKH